MRRRKLSAPVMVRKSEFGRGIWPCAGSLGLTLEPSGHSAASLSFICSPPFLSLPSLVR